MKIFFVALLTTPPITVAALLSTNCSPCEWRKENTHPPLSIVWDVWQHGCSQSCEKVCVESSCLLLKTNFLLVCYEPLGPRNESSKWLKNNVKLKETLVVYFIHEFFIVDPWLPNNVTFCWIQTITLQGIYKLLRIGCLVLLQVNYYSIRKIIN